MTAGEIINKYIAFFEGKDHKRIPNSPLVPQNDPTTLFTNSGMQPLIPYLAGEPHPEGKRFVNVQNCFRGQGALDDINEVGDNRHLTFFRMLGNWSLGDYFKKEQLPWMFAYLTQDLGLDPKKLYVSVFAGYKEIPKDEDAIAIWTEIFTKAGLDPKERIFEYGPEKNWWSRAGVPENMPAGELGGPDSEIFYDFETEHDPKFGEKCHINCDCGRFLEISNNVFMEYKKKEDGSFGKLPQRNVDHGAGAERILMAAENQQDVFLTSLFYPVIQTLEKQTGKTYAESMREMRMITAHLSSSCFIVNAGVYPSNKEQGYILRRLIRRAVDSFNKLHGSDVKPLLEVIVDQYKETDPDLIDNFEKISNVIIEETTKYKKSLSKAKAFLVKKYSTSVIPSAAEESHTTELPDKHSGVRSLHYGRDDKKSGRDDKETGGEIMGTVEISPDDAFVIYTTHGLSPTQIKSLGYTFDEQAFAEKMKAHKDLSKAGAGQKFRGGLADHQEKTIMGHTATHLMHQAIRDLLGKEVHQSGSNITTERVRFDFNFDRKLTDEEIKHLEDVVTEKIKQNLPVHFEMIPTEDAKQMGAIGLFEDTYADVSKIYFIGGDSKNPQNAYSIEFCGGPHVDFTEQVKSFKIIKQEALGRGFRRIYAVVGE